MYTAIIVEPRNHKALPFVVNNVIDNLSNDWNVIIFHGNMNINYVNNIVKTSNRIKLHNLNVDNFTRNEYSRLLMTKSFYDNIPTETFLIFQTDTMIFSKNKNYINRFLQYDYVGAPWPHLNNQIGNGGFSLRKKSKMIEILEKEEIPDDPNYAEDLFFALPKNVSLYKPSIEEAKYFSFECEFFSDTFACHQPWIINKEIVLSHNPDAEKLFELNDMNTIILKEHPEVEKLFELNDIQTKKQQQIKIRNIKMKQIKFRQINQMRMKQINFRQMNQIRMKQMRMKQMRIRNMKMKQMRIRNIKIRQMRMKQMRIMNMRIRQMKKKNK
jgi:hypothetical protein